MTIAATWVRTLASGAEELMFCSDSRLSNGKRFDHSQKIFRFARSDAAICFAGGTDWAYPMIVAAIKAADIHVPSQTRALRLADFKAHIINILNCMQSEVHNFADGQDIPDVTFIFGGYDWVSKQFRIWRFEFDKAAKKFVAHERLSSSGFGALGRLEMAGDPEWTAALRKKVKAISQNRYGLAMRQPSTARFNMEPFEAIRDLLTNASPSDSIGGAPQAVKVYQYLNSTDIGIFWPKVCDGRLFLSGRPLLDYERANIRSVLDPETLISTWSDGSTANAAHQINCATTAARECCVSDESAEAPDIPE